MKLKYLALCLTVVSCTQTFGLWHETSPIFKNTGSVITWLTERGISGGHPILSKECILGEGSEVTISCDSSEKNTRKFLSIAKIIASLSSWFILRSKPEQYQVTRTFEKQFTCFGLLNWLGIRSNEKNILFGLRNALFEKPGITQTENYLK